MDESTFVGVGGGSEVLSPSSSDASGHGVVTERVQALANGVYREFAQVVGQYGEGPVTSLMPIIITVLESLDGALLDLSDSQRALEEANDDNEQLHAQYEKEKQMRRDEQAKRMRNEDQGDDERRDLKQQLEHVGSHNRQLKAQLKALKDRAERSEEKGEKLKTEFVDLQMKYRRINHVLQQQMSVSNVSVRPRTSSGARLVRHAESPGPVLTDPAQVLEAACLETATRSVGITSPLATVNPGISMTAVRHHPIADELNGFNPPAASSPLPAPETTRQIQDAASPVPRLDLETPPSPVSIPSLSDTLEIEPEESEPPQDGVVEEEPTDIVPASDAEKDEDVMEISEAVTSQEELVGESLEAELMQAGKEDEETGDEPAGLEDEKPSEVVEAIQDPSPPAGEREAADEVSTVAEAVTPAAEPVLAIETEEASDTAQQDRPTTLQTLSSGVDDDSDQQPSPESMMLDLGNASDWEEVERLTVEKRDLETALELSEADRLELRRQLDEVIEERVLLAGRVETAQQERSEMQTRYRAIEADLQERTDRLEELERREQANQEPLFPGSNDNEPWLVNQKRQYSRIEVTRLIKERNDFKERYLSLKEKLQILQQRLEAPTPKKKEKSLWKVFSDMFKGKPVAASRSPARPRRNTKYTALNEDENATPPPTVGIPARHKNVQAAIVFEDGRRFEAYGWSLPEAMAPRSMTSGKSMPQDTGAIMAKSSEINRLDSVPVLMHCGHLNTEPSDQFAFSAPRTWCAAAVCSTVQSNPSLHPSDTVCPSSLIWVCTGSSELSRVNVIDANMPGEVIDSFPVCSSPLLCIASVPGVEDDENMIHIASATEDSSTLTPGELEQYRYHSPTQSPPPLQISPDHFENSKRGKTLAATATDGPDSPPDKVISLREAFQDSPKTGRAHSKSLSGEVMARPRLRLPTMWMGAEFGCLYIHSAVSAWRSCLHAMKVEASVLSIVYAQQKVFVAMANSSLAIFKRDRDEWDWEGYKVTYLGRNRDVPISVMVAVKHRIWCGVGNRVYVVDANTNQIETNFEVHPSVRSRVLSLVVSGDGVWISVRLDSTLRLFHADTFQNLQDVDVAKPIQTLLTFPGSKRKPSSKNLVRISTLLISNNCLWVGASNGTIISLPLTNKRPVEGHETPRGANTSFSSFSILGEDVTAASDGSMDVAIADASDVGVPQDIPYLSLDASRLSFHGHVHNVDVLVATPGVMATRTVKVLTDGASTPKRVSSAAVTFITSIGGGYVDFRSDAGAASGSSGGTGSSSGGQAADRNHIIVWQVSANNLD